MISSSCGVSVACLGLMSSILIVLINSYVKPQKSAPPADAPYAAQTSGQASGRFGFGLEEFGEFFDGFGLFDDMHGENVRGRSFLKFVAQFGSELVEAVDAFAKFSFV